MPGERVAVLRNVRYCSSGGACCSHACKREDPLNKHLLDIYLPEREAGTPPPPVVFFVHGGGWRRGHKNGWKHYLSFYDTNLFFYLLLRLFGVYDNVGRSFSRAGVACVVPSYRLACTPCHLFAVELCVSLFFSLATIFPLVWGGTRALASVVVVAPFFPEERGGGLPLATLLNISILVLWSAMTVRFRYYGRWCLLVLWTSLAVTVLVCGDPSIITSGSLNHTAILLSITYITLFANYISTFTAGECSTKEALLDIQAAYQWTVNYGHSTGLYDVHRLYLCGHSAGAHLALLGMLQCQIGADSTSCIKGFIGLSGAYNITQMRDSAVTRNFYLKPTFGAETSGGWEKNSPLLLILACKNAETKREPNGCHTAGTLHLPPTLLVTASFDFGLDQQSQELMTALRDRGVAAEHVILPGHNHFSVISLFGKSMCNDVLSKLVFRNRADAWRHCVAFITRNKRKTYESLL